jgi:hypothetical protein
MFKLTTDKFLAKSGHALTRVSEPKSLKSCPG